MPIEVEIVVMATIIGINIDQIDRKVINKKINAIRIATNCPRFKSSANTGETSCLIAGGPETFTLFSPASFSAERRRGVKSAAFWRL